MSSVIVWHLKVDCLRYWEKRRLGVEEFRRVKKCQTRKLSN